MLEQLRPFAMTKKIVKEVGNQEEQQEMDRNITKREEVTKEDMSRVGEGDGFENIERCVWLSFVGAGYGWD